MDQLTLVANPGSASRKYALYAKNQCLITVHFEFDKGEVIYTTSQQQGIPMDSLPANLSEITSAADKLTGILEGKNLLKSNNQIASIALRIVAPSSYFQQDRILDKAAMDKLAELKHKAPLHIDAVLREAKILKGLFPKAKLVGISDSYFHATMPERTRNYALPLKDSQRLDIKRFGYHGLSAESIVQKLRSDDKLPKRLIICHLGSGVSLTAARSGKSVDTTMGYSPLEGLMMSTRSGNLDISAVQVLQADLKLSDREIETYLNQKSGLLGVSGLSSDIRELFRQEAKGNKNAKLALDMYVYRIQQAVGQMSAALGGIDALAFTGTVGERSAEIRKRVIKRLMFLGLMLENKLNHQQTDTDQTLRISPSYCPVKIYAIPTDEYSMIIKKTHQLLKVNNG